VIRLTKIQADKIGYLLIKKWYAIQPIEIKDGTFILPERVRDDIEKFLIEGKNIVDVQKTSDTLTDIKKYPVKKLDPSELKPAPIDEQIIKR